MCSTKIKLRNKDAKLLKSIYEAMSPADLQEAKEKYGEKPNRYNEKNVLNDKKDLRFRGYDENWCGSYVFYFAKNTREKNEDSFKEALKELRVKNDPTKRINSEGVTPNKARKIFTILTKANSVSETECLCMFLQFCKRKGYSLDVLLLKDFDLDKTINDIKSYLETEQNTIFSGKHLSKSDYGFEFVKEKDSFLVRECKGGRELIIPDLSENKKIDRIESILFWQYRATEFIGRKRELYILKEWLEDDSPKSVKVMYGDSGVGKSRLAFHFAEEVLLDGWRAGTHDGILTGKWVSGKKGLLLILDHAEENAYFIRQLLQSMSQMGDAHTRLRVLLICRDPNIANNVSVQSRGLFCKPLPLLSPTLMEEKWRMFCSTWESLNELHLSDKKIIELGCGANEKLISRKLFEEWISSDKHVLSRPLILIALANFLFFKDNIHTKNPLSGLDSRKILNSIVQREVELIENEIVSSNLNIETESILLTIAISIINDEMDEASIRKLEFHLSKEELDYYPASISHLKHISRWQSDKLQQIQPDLIGAEFLYFCLSKWAKGNEAKWLLAILDIYSINSPGFDHSKILINVKRLSRIFVDMSDGILLQVKFDSALQELILQAPDKYGRWVTDNLQNLKRTLPRSLINAEIFSIASLPAERTISKAYHLRLYIDSLINNNDLYNAERVINLLLSQYSDFSDLDLVDNFEDEVESLLLCANVFIYAGKFNKAEKTLEVSSEAINVYFELVKPKFNRGSTNIFRLRYDALFLRGVCKYELRKASDDEASMKLDEIRSINNALKGYHSLQIIDGESYGLKYAECALMLSNVLIFKKRFSAASKLLVHAAQIFSEHHQLDRVGVIESYGLCLYRLSMCYWLMDHCESAKDTLRQAIDLTGEVLGYDWAYFGDSFLFYISIYLYKFEISLSYLKQADEVHDLINIYLEDNFKKKFYKIIRDVKSRTSDILYKNEADEVNRICEDILKYEENE